MTLPASFHGYPRDVGRAGVRNHLLILSVCGLNGAQALRVSAAVPDAALVLHPYGRGQVGADRAFSDRIMTAMTQHPNVGGVLVLAPDAGLRSVFQSAAADAGRLAEGLSLEECGEDGAKLIVRATAMAQEMLSELKEMPRKACPIADLAIALECGHSDAWSGLIANPLAGELTDALVEAGGAALFSETLEWLGCGDILAARAVNPEVGDRLKAFLSARQAIASAAGKDLRIGNPGPQNHAGGITTLEEKSLGAIRKGGTGPIVAALAEGEALTGPGLHVMDTPTLSPESITSMVSAGAQIVCFTTGAGNPYGSALAPTLKVTGTPGTASRLPSQIDVDAAGSDRPLAAIFEAFVATANGRLTAAERAGEAFEVISRLGPSV